LALKSIDRERQQDSHKVIHTEAGRAIEMVGPPRLDLLDLCPRRCTSSSAALSSASARPSEDASAFATLRYVPAKCAGTRASVPVFSHSRNIACAIHHTA